MFLFFYGCWGAFHQDAFVLVDGANLLFHEAGHVFFHFLGEYAGIWGGTLLQLLIPFTIALGFLKHRDVYAACIMFYWAGENMFSISRYIKDARAQVLPYVGGEIHDWFYILSRAGWLQHDQLIGNTVWILGFLIMMGMAVSAAFNRIPAPGEANASF